MGRNLSPLRLHDLQQREHANSSQKLAQLPGHNHRNTANVRIQGVEGLGERTLLSRSPSKSIDTSAKAGLRCTGLPTDGHFRRGDPVWSCPTPLLSLLLPPLCLE